MKAAKKSAGKAVETQDEDHGKSQAAAQLSSIIEMVREREAAGDDDTAREAVEQRIQEAPLEVSVRSGWCGSAQDPCYSKPEEFKILLCTGGPAARLIGTLNDYGSPGSVKLEYQDWGTPWTEYRLDTEEEKAVRRYCGCFYFGE